MRPPGFPTSEAESWINPRLEFSRSRWEGPGVQGPKFGPSGSIDRLATAYEKQESSWLPTPRATGIPLGKGGCFEQSVVRVKVAKHVGPPRLGVWKGPGGHRFFALEEAFWSYQEF